MRRWTGMMTLLAFLLAGAAIGQTKSVSESTTKEKDAQGSMKTKTKTVTGTVKEYEAGKKIVVTGPKDKDYSFDLSENVATKGTIGVGERVKVTYSKTDGGDKVTTVEASPAASHPKKTNKTAA